jgi:hypothetical protein
VTRWPSTRRAGGLVVALAVLLAAGEALAGALVLDVDDGEPEQLDDGVVGYLRPGGGSCWSVARSASLSTRGSCSGAKMATAFSATRA